MYEVYGIYIAGQKNKDKEISVFSLISLVETKIDAVGRSFFLKLTLLVYLFIRVSFSVEGGRIKKTKKRSLLQNKNLFLHPPFYSLLQQKPTKNAS